MTVIKSNDVMKNFGKTARQIADEAERERVKRGVFVSDPLSHLPQAEQEAAAPIRGVSPHYSPGTAIVHEQALEAPLTELQQRGNGGYHEGSLKKAKQSHYPENVTRIATGLERERAEAERITNAGNQ
jgi:hypothetical protein